MHHFSAILMPIHTPGTCFSHVFFSFFFDLKIARDDSGLEYMNSDFATDFFLKKLSFFLFMKKVDNAKIQKIASVFRDFLCFCVTKIKSEKTRLGAAVQQ